jgi:hypothetical protein
MIHAGASHPEAQVEAMDHHIERMERLLGQRAEGKVHWVRGKVFGSLPGAGGFCLFGVAVGTAPGSQELGPDGLAFTDRHEVAHWAISRFFKPYQVLPPTALIEGWAESQSGYSQSRLYGQALSCRQAQTWLPLSRLVIPGEDILYSRVYRQGGVLVDYLLDRYGGPSFFALYHGCTSAGFDADCKRLLDRRLDELEIEYTRHLDETIAKYGSLQQWQLVELRCGPSIDPVKWRQLVQKCVDAQRVLAGRYVQGRLKAQTAVRSLIHPEDDGVDQSDYALSGPFAFGVQSRNTWQSITLARPDTTWDLYREMPQTSWHQQHVHDRGDAYRSTLQVVRGAIGDLSAPSLLMYDDWAVVDPAHSSVTELTEYVEAGRPLVRITLEEPREVNGPRIYQSWLLAADQEYVPLSMELAISAMIVRCAYTYEQIDGHPFLKQRDVNWLSKDGRLPREESTVVKERNRGPVAEDEFTLRALGVKEAEIVQIDAAEQALLRAAFMERTPRWRSTLVYWPAGWAGLALLLGLTVTWGPARKRR